MSYIIGDIWTVITLKLIGEVLKLAWFLTRAAFYLALFLILSAGGNILAVIRGCGNQELTGIGDYTKDGLYWHDHASGQLYPVHPAETEQCEICGTERRVDWRKSALSRLVRDPAIIRCQFDAVTDGTKQVAGSVSFSRHARQGIHHIDDLDPQRAEPETTDMTESHVWIGDHDSAAAALEHLDSVLRARGWDDNGAYGSHWYSRKYQRPVILWDQPVQTGEAPAIPAA